MNDKLAQFTKEIKAQMVEYVTYNEVSNEELKARIEEVVRSRAAEMYLTIDEEIEVGRKVYSSIRGLGVLDEILNDDNITEIMINGPDCIFVERNGKIERLDRHFESAQRLADIIQRIVGAVGREVTDSNPIADARLKDGSRVNVVLPPVALNGPIVTIRKFSKDPMTIEKLIEYGSITPQIADVLRDLVESRYNIFISGGTGSGKTTFLNALSNFIPQTERIITIEDSAELQIFNIPNIVKLETKNANSTEKGAITIRDLIKSALRMRPDRIIVGEVRGAEALDMLQAMNTGHDGSLSTGHANSTADMLSRLETMVLQGAEGLPLAAIRQQISSAVDVIIHLARMRDHSRKTMEITEVLGLDDRGRIILNPLYQFVEDDSSTMECVSGKLLRTKNEMKKTMKLLMAGEKRVF